MHIKPFVSIHKEKTHIHAYMGTSKITNDMIAIKSEDVSFFDDLKDLILDGDQQDHSYMYNTYLKCIADYNNPDSSSSNRNGEKYGIHNIYNALNLNLMSIYKPQYSYIIKNFRVIYKDLLALEKTYPKDSKLSDLLKIFMKHESFEDDKEPNTVYEKEKANAKGKDRANFDRLEKAILKILKKNIKI